MLKLRLKKYIGGHYGKKFCHFFKIGKVCPFDGTAGIKSPRYVNFKDVKTTLCQYRHCATNVTVETVGGYEENESVTDIDKVCDEVLAHAGESSHYKKQYILGDIFIEKIKINPREL